MLKNIVSAGGIVIKTEEGKKKICLVQLRLPMKGYVFPKGHVEQNESYEKTALREVGEETGLQELRILRKLGVVTRKSIENDGTKVIKDIHLFLMATNKLEHTKADEKYKWFSFDETIEKLTFKEEQDFIKEHKPDLSISNN